MRTPYFFKYADKEDDKVEPINNSTMNRICHNIIPNPRNKF